MCILLCNSHHYASPELFFIFKNSTPCTSTNCSPFLPPYRTPRNHHSASGLYILDYFRYQYNHTAFLTRLFHLVHYSQKIHLHFRNSQNFVLFKTEISVPLNVYAMFCASIHSSVNICLVTTLRWEECSVNRCPSTSSRPCIEIFFSVYPETNGQVSHSLAF